MTVTFSLAQNDVTSRVRAIQFPANGNASTNIWACQKQANTTACLMAEPDWQKGNKKERFDFQRLFAFSRRELNSNVRVNMCVCWVNLGKCKNAKVTHIYSTVNSEFRNYFCSVNSTSSSSSVSMEIENLPSKRNFRYNQNIVRIRFFTASLQYKTEFQYKQRKNNDRFSEKWQIPQKPQKISTVLRLY